MCFVNNIAVVLNFSRAYVLFVFGFFVRFQINLGRTRLEIIVILSLWKKIKNISCLILKAKAFTFISTVVLYRLNWYMFNFCLYWFMLMLVGGKGTTVPSYILNGNDARMQMIWHWFPIVFIYYLFIYFTRDYIYSYHLQFLVFKMYEVLMHNELMNENNADM